MRLSRFCGRRRDKYWLMTPPGRSGPGVDYVLNRVRLYRDRHDWVIQSGDTARRQGYPSALGTRVVKMLGCEGSTARREDKR